MMLRMLFEKLKVASLLLLFLTIVLGVIYPMMVTGLGQWLFPWQANGSLLAVQEQVIGSRLIGQSFSNPRYFWGRPSATPLHAYNAQSSGGSNWSPANPRLREAVRERVQKLENSDKSNLNAIPVDLVTASGSGLDPDISPMAALYQVSRIAKARGLPEAFLEKMIQERTQGRFLGIFGEPRVNVLELNSLLDSLNTRQVEQ